MAKHIVKCFYCKESFDANEEEFVKINSRRYAHKKCYNQTSKEETKEESDLAELHSFLQELFKEDYCYLKIKHQVDSYAKYNGYTPKTILYTLKYFYEVLNNDISKSNGGIGIVPYVYSEAAGYYKKLNSKTENANESASILLEKTVEVIKIKSPKLKPRKKQKFFEE